MKNSTKKTNYGIIIKELRTELKSNLEPRRLQHTQNVVDESIRLAKENDANVEKAELIALAHDRFRDTQEEGNALNHGRLAAEYVRHKFGIDDEDILNSIIYHTTGRYGMSLQEKIIFLADAIEKNRDYEGVEHIREDAKNGINYGVRASLINTINHLKEVGRDIDKSTTEALKFIENEISDVQ